MAFLKRLAFYKGVLLGLATVALAGGVALTYLFTGKFPVINIEGKNAQLGLMTPDEIAALAREQIKAHAAPASEEA